MTQMLFYKDVVALSSEIHGSWKHLPATDFSFAAQTNSVPLLLPEIPDAAREFPVVFVKTGDNDYVLAGLLGLRDNESLMIDQAGKWDGRYLPAFVRRYPFVLSEADDGNFVVCADQSATTLLGESIAGEALFLDGKPSAHTQQLIAFLESFRVQALESAEWARRMAELGLLEEARADAQLNDGQRFVLNGIFVVSEAKLHKLPAADIQSLFERGDLARIYGHLLSLGHFGKFVDRLAARQALNTPA